MCLPQFGPQQVPRLSTTGDQGQEDGALVISVPLIVLLPAVSIYRQTIDVKDHHSPALATALMQQMLHSEGFLAQAREVAFLPPALHLQQQERPQECLEAVCFPVRIPENGQTGGQTGNDTGGEKREACQDVPAVRGQVIRAGTGDLYGSVQRAGEQNAGFGRLRRIRLKVHGYTGDPAHEGRMVSLSMTC